MSDSSLNERITRLLAYMLRHQPDDFDVELDAYGYGDVEDVVRALTERTGEEISLDDLESAIAAGGRQRYEIKNGRIRALYGHSIEIDPGESTEPPEELYLGLAARDRGRMERYGLRGGRRRFLHLSTTEAEAKETGARLAEEYIVVEVNATDAWEQGVDFFDRKSMWLAAELPSYALKVIGEHDDGNEPEQRGGRGRRDGGRERGGRGGRGRGRRDEERGGRRGGRGRDRDDDDRDDREERDDERGEKRGRRRGGRGRDRDRDDEKPRRDRDDDRKPRRERDDERSERKPRGDRDKARKPRNESAPREDVEQDRTKREPEPAAPRKAAGDAFGSFGAGVDEQASKPADRKPEPKPKPERQPERKAEPEPQQDTGGGFGAGI